MWLVPVVCLAVAAFAAISLRVVPPPRASTLVWIRAGAVQVRRGRVDPLAREHVAEILSEARVSRGFIAVTAENRVVFSRGIPAAVHQRLRNVLLNR